MTIRISIFEDDAPIRQALEQYINRAAGFECVSAYEDPRVALRQLPLDKPDVVLMDLQLPGMSGIECVAALRRQSPAIRAIMLTVFERDEQIFESLAAGAYGYLVISVHTVRCYSRRSYEKLQVHSRTEAVAKFRGH